MGGGGGVGWGGGGGGGGVVGWGGGGGGWVVGVGGVLYHLYWNMSQFVKDTYIGGTFDWTKNITIPCKINLDSWACSIMC